MSSLFFYIWELHYARPVNVLVAHTDGCCLANLVSSQSTLTHWIKNILTFSCWLCFLFFFFFSPIKCLPSKVLLIFFIFFFPKHLILKKKDQRNGSSCNWKGMIKTSNHFPSICPRILPSLHEYWENEASENSKSTEKISSCWHSCQHFSIKNKKK